MQLVATQGSRGGNNPCTKKWLLAKILLFISVKSISGSNNGGRHFASRRPFGVTIASAATTKQEASSTTTAAPWQSEVFLSKKDWDNLQRYQRNPPTIFAPGGRLYSVERLMEVLSAPDDDPTSNLVVAIQCQDGLVVVTNVNPPPNAVAMFLPPPSSKSLQNATTTTNTSENSNDDDATREGNKLSLSLWLDSPLEGASHRPPASSSCIVQIPFAENENIFAITAGNAVHSQILRNRIQQMAESIYYSNDDGGGSELLFNNNNGRRFSSSSAAAVPVLARRLADQFQKPTQGEGPKTTRMLVSCALIVGVNEGIWQIDPTGQFWQCQAAVVGSGADAARSYLLQKVAEAVAAQVQQQQECPSNTSSYDGESKTDVSNDAGTASYSQVESFLNQLPIHDAIKLALECLQHTIMGGRRGKGKGKDNQPPAFMTTTTTTSSTSNHDDDDDDDDTKETKTTTKTTTKQTSNQPSFLAFSIRKLSSNGGKQEVQWYSPKDFEEVASESESEPAQQSDSEDNSS